MPIKYRMSKNFNMSVKKPKVIFFGNGFFYADKSWDGFIQASATDEYNSISEDVKNKITNTIRASIFTPTKDSDRWAKYGDVLNSTNYDLNKELVKELLSKDFDAILTTNYTYQLENAIDNKFVGAKNKTDKYVCCAVSQRMNVDGKFLLHTFNRVSNKDEKNAREYDIWHIHGEHRVPSSMVLTHDEYGKMFGKISDFINNIKGAYKNQKNDLSFESWIDYLILADIYIIGYGCKFAEFDFWWLLSRRKREEADKGTITCFLPDTEENKPVIEALKLMDVTVDNCGFTGDKIDYNAFYSEALKKM